MDLAKYQTISGITVPSADQTRVTAQIARTRRILESILGYPLQESEVNTNIYNELGKTSEVSCPIVDTDNLDAADSVTTAYRLFTLNEHDEYWQIDPFTVINAVKLVYVKQGASPSGITVKTFDSKYIRAHKIHQWSKWLQYYPYDYDLHCGAYYLQLAVDAVWQWDDDDNIPDDLLDVWADMVTFYADLNKDVKDETILTHRISKYDNKTGGEQTKPEMHRSNQAILEKYAGGNGSLSKLAVL